MTTTSASDQMMPKVSQSVLQHAIDLPQKNASHFSEKSVWSVHVRHAGSIIDVALIVEPEEQTQ